jgi:hypothetical protein
VYYSRPISVAVWKPVVWAVFGMVAGLWVLRWPDPPSGFDHLRWGAVLVATYGIYRFYNRIDKQTRVLLYPLLQLLRVGAFLAVVPSTAIADLALIVQVIIRWVNYYLYRTRDGRWPTEDLAAIRLTIFGAASLLLAAQHDWGDLWAPTTVSLLAWHLFLARHTLPRSLAQAHRIDVERPARPGPSRPHSGELLRSAGQFVDPVVEPIRVRQSDLLEQAPPAMRPVVTAEGQADIGRGLRRPVTEQ